MAPVPNPADVCFVNKLLLEHALPFIYTWFAAVPRESQVDVTVATETTRPTEPETRAVCCSSDQSGPGL